MLNARLLVRRCSPGTFKCPTQRARKLRDTDIESRLGTISRSETPEQIDQSSKFGDKPATSCRDVTKGALPGWLSEGPERRPTTGGMR